MAGILEALGLKEKQPEFLKGTEEPLPFPGIYGSKLQGVRDVMYFPARGRSLMLKAGNPINESFGTLLSFRLDGSATHPQQPKQQSEKRMRHFRIGAYYHDRPKGLDIHALVDQSGIVHTKTILKGTRMRGVFAASVGNRNSSVAAGRPAGNGKPWCNQAVARADYRGDTWSAGARVGTTQSVTGAGYAGVSGMKSLTHSLAVGGEVYADAYKFHKRRYPSIPLWLSYSLGAFYKPVQGDWMGAVQYAGQGAGGLAYITLLRNVSPHVALASELIVKASTLSSQLRVGYSIKMPRTKSQLKFSYTTGGFVTSCWERRLLTTVKLQVTGRLDMYAHRGKERAGGNQFGCYLQIGYSPPEEECCTPSLMAWAVPRDIIPQK